MEQKAESFASHDFSLLFPYNEMLMYSSKLYLVFTFDLYSDSVDSQLSML